MTKKEYEIAPQIQFKKVEEVANIFLDKILGHKEAAMTDEVYLSDFRPMNDIERAIGQGTKPGEYRFQIRFRQGPFYNQREDWEIKEWEETPVHWRSTIVTETKKLFNVDISSVFDKPFVEIVQFIIENYQPKTVPRNSKT